MMVRSSPRTTSSRSAGCRIHTWSGGSGQLRREAPAIVGEEQDRVGRADDLQLAHVVPADQRHMDGTDRTGQRMSRLGGGLGRSDPLRAAAHRHRIAVRCHPPGRHTIGSLADGGQDDLHASAVRIKGDARAGGRDRACGVPSAPGQVPAPCSETSSVATSTMRAGSRMPSRSGSGSASRSSRSRQRSTTSRA